MIRNKTGQIDPKNQSTDKPKYQNIASNLRKLQKQ